MAVTAGEVIMEFGMKRVLASVQAAATLNKLYDGSPVSLTASVKSQSCLLHTLSRSSKSCGRVTW